VDRPSGPFTATVVVVAVSNLSVGSGVIVIFSCWAHLTASARFRARAPGPYPAGYPRPASWRTGIAIVVSRCLSATGIRFSVILFPPGNWALLTVGLPNAPTGASGPRRGYHVPHARAATGEGALCTPGTTVLTPTEATSGRAPAASQRPVPAPRHTSHRRGSRLMRHTTVHTKFARPVFPSPVAARMERGCQRGIVCLDIGRSRRRDGARSKSSP
jgi:hypothetical protein